MSTVIFSPLLPLAAHQRVDSVSYTHLDVYKRQEQDDNGSHPCPEGGHVLDAFLAKVGFRLLVGVNMFCWLVAVFVLQPGLGGEMFWRAVRMGTPTFPSVCLLYTSRCV